MAKSGKHDAATERLAIEDLLARFPITGRDRTWAARPVARRAFSAAHRIFEKRFKDKLKSEPKAEN
ncbi:MAG: hypothetical protein K2Y27_00110 [Xanthobacteraceae bacterium]|nr:hypothetical protein [Xanthobacteraceae bacterium]